MTDATFYIIWLFSFFLYFGIYTLWIPLKTQMRIEKWLRSAESDDTLLLSLDVITTRIREQMLIDFEEFMLPQARENLQKFWAGAMGNVAKDLKNSEEGSQLSMLHNMTKELDSQPWYIQMAASRLLPMLGRSATSAADNPITDAVGRMGLRK